ncbi:MAG: T9SS type A sorting domain-containing protein [Cyclobacteriaceae bacterium]
MKFIPFSGLLLASLLFIFTLFSSIAATKSTVQSGSWSDGATWGGSVPSAGDAIVLKHAVTYSGGNLSVSSIDFQASYHPTPKSVGQLTINSGTLTVTGGNVDLDNSADFGLGKHYITVASGATFSVTNGSLRCTQSGQTVTVNGTLNVANGNVELNSSSCTFTLGSLGTANITTGDFKVTQSSCTIDVNGGDLDVYGTFQSAASPINFSTGSLTASLLHIKSSSTVTTGSGFLITLDSLYTADNSGAIFNNNGTANISGNINMQGPVNNYGTMTAGGLAGNGSGNSVFNNYGNLDFSNAILVPSATKFYLHPSSTCIVDGDFTVTGNENLVVGTDVAPPPYADMIIKGDIIVTGSGDIRVKQNGRLAVYGDISADGSGGSFFTLDNGGQAFVGGDVTYPGGGDGIVNNNSGGNIGLYIDGVVDVSSGNVGDSETEGGYASSDYLRDTEGGGDFYNWISTAEDSPLPVELLSFKAEQKELETRLIWVTGSEINNQFFTVEKSLDGKSFVHQATIKGFGNTTDKQFYEWVDDGAGSGVTYYKLSQTDYDGTTKVLGIRALNIARLEGNISFYPNPIRSGETLRFSGVAPERLMVINQSGQIVFDQQVVSQKFDLSSDIKPGLYFIKVFSGGNSATERLYVE